MGFIFYSFFTWRILDIIIAYIAKIYDRYEEHFIYKYILYKYTHQIPHFLVSFANYDGAHYLYIARFGYHQYEQAFFPFYPLLIRLISPVFGASYFLSGLFLANISFLVGLYLFKEYLKDIGKNQKTIAWIFLFLLTFPTSFFFGALYTEGLFFLLVAGSLFFMQKKKYLYLAVFCFFAALTRLMGVFLLFPLFVTLIFEQQRLQLIGTTFQDRFHNLYQFVRKNSKPVLVLFAPLVGLFCYTSYLLLVTHDPLSFYHGLAAFHTGRSTTHFILLPQVYYRYIHIFSNSSHNVAYYVAVLEFIVFNLFFLVLLYDLWFLWKKSKEKARMSLIGLNIFSLINLLLPTFTGTLTSVPRYALFSLSFFLRLSGIKNIFVKITLLILFLIFHVLLLTFFIQGFFIS